MKKLLFASFFIFQLENCFAQKIINDENVEQRKVPDFHALKVSNAFTVLLSQGSETAVAVSANQKEYVTHIRSEVINGTLQIWYDGKGKWWNNKKLKAYISVKSLDEIKASGATDIKIEGELNSTDLNIDFSGASDMKGTIYATGKLQINLSGASDIEIKGSSSETVIEANGASDMKAYDFKTGICNIKASGASDVHITVDKELSAHLSGASSVSYKGSALIKDIKTSGSSNVSKKS